MCIYYFWISKHYLLFKGCVTTFKPQDLPTLRNILSEKPEPILKAGLHPTADQIELYAYHLPNSTLSNLVVSEIKL